MGYTGPMNDDAVRAAYPFLDLLEAAAPALREEALAVPPELWLPARGYSDGVEVAVLLAERFMKEFTKEGVAAVRACCPVAAQVVGAIPGARLAGYQRFHPGAKMALHTDPRADHMVRCILGLQLPTLEQRWWREGTARLIDTRLPHWARNDDTRPRYTLVIDVLMPFAVDGSTWGPWRPDAPIPRPDTPETEWRAAHLSEARRQLLAGPTSASPGCLDLVR